MAVKSYNAGVKEYRQTYWEPEYKVQDTDILVWCCILDGTYYIAATPTSAVVPEDEKYK